MVLANRAAAAYHRSMLLAPDVAPPPAIIRAHCPAGHAHVRCGFVRVPLDHQNPTGPTIRVYFERYLRQDRPRPRRDHRRRDRGRPRVRDDGEP